MKTTTATKINPIIGFLRGVLMGIAMFPVGFFFILIPIIGWVVGPVLMLGALLAPILMMGLREGPCPVCGKRIIMILEDARTCAACESRIIRKEDQFICYK